MTHCFTLKGEDTFELVTLFPRLKGSMSRCLTPSDLISTLPSDIEVCLLLEDIPQVHPSYFSRLISSGLENKSTIPQFKVVVEFWGDNIHFFFFLSLGSSTVT